MQLIMSFFRAPGDAKFDGATLRRTAAPTPPRPLPLTATEQRPQAVFGETILTRGQKHRELFASTPFQPLEGGNVSVTDSFHICEPRSDGVFVPNGHILVYPWDQSKLPRDSANLL